MKIYWRIWCPHDPEWAARGVVETDGQGGEAGFETFRGLRQANFEIQSATQRLRDRLGVEPPGVNYVLAPEDCRCPEILAEAKGPADHSIAKT